MASAPHVGGYTGLRGTCRVRTVRSGREGPEGLDAIKAIGREGVGKGFGSARSAGDNSAESAVRPGLSEDVGGLLDVVMTRENGIPSQVHARASGGGREGGDLKFVGGIRRVGARQVFVPVLHAILVQITSRVRRIVRA